MPTNASDEVHGTVPVDHLVFYAGRALGALASFFERLGFTLTPLGRHDSGSINRLAILERQYLELIGFEEGTPATVRPELQSLPPGLTGIAAADLPEVRRASGQEGLLPPRRLERRVTTPGGEGLALFTTTEVRDPARDVRVFLCRHHTPSLVWHPAWQQHPNGAVAATEVRLSTRDPQRLHAALRTAFDLRHAGAAQAYDAAGTVLRVVPAGERAAVTLRTRDLDAAQATLAAAGVACTLGQGRVVVPLPEPYAADIVFAAP
jgi:hypothetical protein